MTKYVVDKTLPKNLPLLMKQRAQEYGNVFVQAAKDKNGVFQYHTYAKVYEEILSLALALKSINVKKGSNIAMISDNRREWLVTDLAIQTLGCADVPRGCDSVGTEIRFIISFADCEYGFFENAKQVKKILEKQEEVPLLKTVILFDHPSEDDKEILSTAKFEILYFDQLMEKGRKIFAQDKDSLKNQLESDMEKIEENDTATIIFTSGTTGTPKGVMLTHKNYLVQLSIFYNLFPCKVGDWWMTVLPVWHSFERLFQYVAIGLKCGLAYSKPMGAVLLADMATIRPQWMCGVPRLWEAIAKGIYRAMNKKGGVTLKLFNFFISVGKLYANQKDKVFGNVCRIQEKKRSRFLDFIAGIIPFILLWPLHKLGDVLVYSKIRAKFGGKMSMAGSGGGALQKDIDDFYRAIDFKLLEGYGITETAPGLSVRNFRHPRPGCVGVVFPTVELKVVKEEHGIMINSDPLPPGKQGLILIRSAQVMKGYYKRPDLTEKAIDKDGWFNSGDLGILTWDNEIKITGRAKDTIVLLDGENIEPSLIESALCTSDYIESAMALGQDRKFLAALIVPSKEAVMQYAKEKGIDSADWEALLKNPQIKTLISDEVNQRVNGNTSFRKCEAIYKFELLSDSFAIGCELSAKQEMMRYKIAEKYKDLIDGMYN